MKKLFRKKTRQFSIDKNNCDQSKTDIKALIETIGKIEKENTIDLGKRIHQFEYLNFNLRLDRDVTGMYRLVVFEGTDRRFSFSIRCKHKDYKSLETSFEEIVRFLSGNRRIIDLPKHEQLKGHYFG